MSTSVLSTWSTTTTNATSVSMEGVQLAKLEETPQNQCVAASQNMALPTAHLIHKRTIITTSTLNSAHLRYSPTVFSQNLHVPSRPTSARCNHASTTPQKGWNSMNRSPNWLTTTAHITTPSCWSCVWGRVALMNAWKLASQGKMWFWMKPVKRLLWTHL